jgi:hypothetical protein
VMIRAIRIVLHRKALALQVIGKIAQVSRRVLTRPLRRKHCYHTHQAQEATNDAAMLALIFNACAASSALKSGVAMFAACGVIGHCLYRLMITGELALTCSRNLAISSSEAVATVTDAGGDGRCVFFSCCRA